MTEDNRHDEFWKDDTLVCSECGGCKCHTCSCPGGPRGPKFHTGLNDEPHRDNKYDNRNYKFNGLFDWISVFSDWFGRDSKW